MTADLTRVLYIAEPIDQSDYGPWKESVAALEKVAISRGWLCYRPSRAWRLDSSIAGVGHEIEHVNRLVMEHCGAVLAHLPAGVPTIGVPREIEWALANYVPVLVATDHPTWSLHDVATIALGDTAEFRSWLEQVEAVVGEPALDAVAFLVEEGGVLPTRANYGDAGFDLYVSEDTVVPIGEFVDVPCGVRVALPPGIFARITGRSSTWRKHRLTVVEGVIDSGYRGPLYAGVLNSAAQDSVTIRRGERIAQLLLHENVAARHVPVAIDLGMFERIPGDGRGEAGFGSSGR